MTAIDTGSARQALIGLPDGAGYGEEPKLDQVYLPPSHLKAMDLSRSLVTGMCGAGKTFWWNALQRREVRRLIDRSSAVSALKDDTEVRAGFGGVAFRPNDYPEINIGANFIMRAHFIETREPNLVWRAVLARHLALSDHPLRQVKDWVAGVGWALEHPEEINRLFYENDREYDKKDKYFLILFDVLDQCLPRYVVDQCLPRWGYMRWAIRGLLQLAVDMRAYRRLRVKIFLRPDQLDKSIIADFPDVSKILASRIELSWPRRELYGLLWQLLANGERGKRFRKFLGGDWRRLDSRSGQGAYQLPRELADEEEQKSKFHQIVGPWMGPNLRRSVPYTWIPNRLSDAQGNVSPRSFLAALRAAAENTEAEHKDHRYALHYDSIKHGVREASRIRVGEIREDCPWVDRVLAPLSGMSVPLEFDEIADLWRYRRILEGLAEEEKEGGMKLPPKNLHRGADGVRIDLESLGIFQRLFDGRVNMPDVFRVGYGLGRKGGVKPVR